MAEQFTNGYALLIAVDENAVQKWSLPDVAKDVAALEEVLVHPERCAYPRDHVKVIKGQEATRQNILDQLEWLQDQVAADESGNATAVVYYTGHGWRDTSMDPPRFYFIPHDLREDKIRSRALRAEDFADAIEALKPQRLLVVLDCCHAAGMDIKDITPTPEGYASSAFQPKALMAGKEAPLGPGAKGLEQLIVGRGRAVLSSSTGEQSSYMRPGREMSVFTYHLIEALTGHAQPMEGATDVLVSDVMSYVTRTVPKSAADFWKRDQDPEFQLSGGSFPVALLLGGKPWAKGQAAPDPLGELPEPQAGLSVGGDYVGGDKIGGDKVGGDKVEGDKITLGNVSGQPNIAIGRGARAGGDRGTED